MFNRTQAGRALVGAAFLVAAGCHGGPGTLPAVPLQPGAAQGAASEPDAKVVLKLSAKSLSFTAVGAGSAKTIVATEKNYKGKFKVSTTCGASVTVSPKTAKGPKGTFKVTPVSAVSSCKLTVSDTAKHKATATISVSIPALNVNPTSLSFDAVGNSYANTFAVTQTGTGAFKESDTCFNIASVATGTFKAPSATVTVTPTGAGTCNVTVTDAYGQQKSVAITVTTSGIIIQ